LKREFKKGKILHEGKTKKVFEVINHPDLVIIQNKDDITKNDDPSQTRAMHSKAILATETTCIVFEFLRKNGLPVAYKERISNTEFLATRSDMLHLEVIERPYGYGSFLSRYPQYLKLNGEIPHRFEEPRFEVFLKTTGGSIISKDGEKIGTLPNDVKTGRPIDDPFIYNPREQFWLLKHPKLPVNEKESGICTIFSGDILPEEISMQNIERIANKTSHLLETFLSFIDLTLVDFKMEFGRGPDGELLIADVLDNDSWRLRTHEWKELSKELFRQNRDMKEIEESYQFVAKELRRAEIISTRKQIHI
jgi:phosphoribosylaminoimidazole-succinocarboxamide synthase